MDNGYHFIKKIELLKRQLYEISVDNIDMEEYLIEYIPDDEINKWVEIFSERERDGKILIRKLEILKNRIINLDGKKYDISEGKKIKKYIHNTMKMKREFIERTKIVDVFIADRVMNNDIRPGEDIF